MASDPGGRRVSRERVTSCSDAPSAPWTLGRGRPGGLPQGPRNRGRRVCEQGTRCSAHPARRRLPPPHRCVRSGPGCATPRPLTADCSLCGLRMSENHIVNCRQMQLYRVRRHDAAVLWLFNHLATRRRTTVIYEQKVWVDTEARNQTPDLFLPDLNRALTWGSSAQRPWGATTPRR